MGLTSPWTLATVGMLAVASPIACALLWNRAGRGRVRRIVLRVSAIATAQVLAVVAAALAINDADLFYTSWSELFGGSGATQSSAQTGATWVDHRYANALSVDFHANRGTLVTIQIPGTASGLRSRPALVYLPAEYGSPQAAHMSFPVVELLDGFPGSPQSWTGPLDVTSVLDGAIAQGRSVPFIAVMPTQNVIYPHDAECVNVAHGAKVETYLTTDVRQAVLSSFRAASGPQGWSLMGYSTGGYCAVNLAMRNPQYYSAAVALSGSAVPAHDRTTGDLFGGSTVLRLQNTPTWEARHWRSSLPLSVLMIAGGDEPYEARAARTLSAMSRGSLRMSGVFVHRGGHNFELWRSVEPYAFNWLSEHTAAPIVALTPPRSVQPGIVPARAASHGQLRANGDVRPCTADAARSWLNGEHCRPGRAS